MDKKVMEEILKAIKGELEFDDDYGYICVDGTDITVSIIDGKAEVDLSFIGEAPIFHGEEIADSIRWIENINKFCYIQSEDPFNKEDNNDEMNNQI